MTCFATFYDMLISPFHVVMSLSSAGAHFKGNVAL